MNLKSSNLLHPGVKVRNMSIDSIISCRCTAATPACHTSKMPRTITVFANKRTCFMKNYEKLNHLWVDLYALYYVQALSSLQSRCLSLLETSNVYVISGCGRTCIFSCIALPGVVTTALIGGKVHIHVFVFCLILILFEINLNNHANIWICTWICISTEIRDNQILPFFNTAQLKNISCGLSEKKVGLYRFTQWLVS